MKRAQLRKQQVKCKFYLSSTLAYLFWSNLAVTMAFIILFSSARWNIANIVWYFHIMPCGTQLPVCIIYKELQNLLVHYSTANLIFMCDLLINRPRWLVRKRMRNKKKSRMFVSKRKGNFSFRTTDKQVVLILRCMTFPYSHYRKKRQLSLWNFRNQIKDHLKDQLKTITYLWHLQLFSGSMIQK